MSTSIDSVVRVDLLSEALDYAARGWRVLPLHSFADGACTCGRPNCTSPAKHPLLTNGVYGATTDEQVIRGWWSEASDANVGIAAGNGLLVLDVDAKHEGLTSLAQLEAQHGPMPTTPTVATGGGGKHYYFRQPEGSKATNRAGIAPGIDVRSDNGYVVAPPSLHASGRRYEWLVSPDTPLAEPPAWLMELLGAVSPAAKPSMTLTVQGTGEDLTTHPGVSEGQRNATLCRLIGFHLACGDDPAELEDLALQWAERCSPPMDEGEVLRTLKGIIAKHERTTSLVVPPVSDDLDLLPLPEPPQWPKLDPAALHGLLGDIVCTLEPATEADPVGVLLSTMVAVGNVVGRGPFYPIEGDHHHANLFAVLVGESSRGRKGTSWGRTLSLFGDADPAWKQGCITTGLSSGEGLIWSVRDPIEVLEPVKEKGRIVNYQLVVKDMGVKDKRLLVVESEFAQSLKVLRREGNTLSPVMRQAWDSGSLTVMTKNNAAKATDTHISILGHITKPELGKCMNDTDCWNGFANRFLWCLVRRSKLLPDGGNGLDLAPLCERLTAAVVKAQEIGAMSRSADARKLWHHLYPELTAERPGLYGAVVGRGEAQTLRLSMLYALLDGQAVIDVEHLQAAAAVWRYCDASAKLIFGQGEAESANPLEQLLLVKIQQQPGINRRGLHRAIGGHIPAKEIVHALAHLRDQRQVHCEVASTGGRPSERWFPATNLAKTTIVVPEPSEATAPLTTSVAVSAVETPRRLTLMELFQAVQAIGGCLRRDAEGCVVDADANAITPEITAAVAEHQATLLGLLPESPMPVISPPADATRVYTKEEWDAAIQAI